MSKFNKNSRGIPSAKNLDNKADIHDWTRERFAVIDVETAYVGGPICEVGIAIMEGQFDENGKHKGLRTVELFKSFVNPKCAIAPEATRVHHIKDSDVRDQPFITEIFEEIKVRIKDVTVVASYNWAYDNARLQYELGHFWRNLVDTKVILDPLVALRMDHVKEDLNRRGAKTMNQDEVATILGIKIDGDKDAAQDAVIAGQILWKVKDVLPANGLAAHNVTEAAISQYEEQRARAKFNKRRFGNRPNGNGYDRNDGDKRDREPEYGTTVGRAVRRRS